MSVQEILTPDNHELFDHVKLRLVTVPPISFEDIALEFGVEARDLIDWFLAYRSPVRPTILPVSPAARFIRDPELRAERQRLRRREESLVTVLNETPMQLAIVQGRIKSIERTR